METRLRDFGTGQQPMRVLGRILISCMLSCAPVKALGQSLAALKVNTQLVVRTVSVKDAKGNPIEGLAAGDFVVTEDGVRQTISVFEFQNLDDTRVADIRNEDRPAPGAAGKAQFRNRRLLAFFFDLGALPEMDRIRALGAARDFINMHMTVVDQVAILSYARGAVRLIQDFTADRGRLSEAVRMLRDRDHFGAHGAHLPFGQNEGEFNIFSTDRRLMALQSAAGMFESLREVKTLIYFAGGAVFNVGNLAQLRATVNAAVRANVSIYPIDARGLPASAPMGSAAEHSPGGTAIYAGALPLGMLRGFQRSQDWLYILAAGTGGQAFLDSNDLFPGILQAQSAASSYYILGYYPTNTALDGRERRISIALQNRTAHLSYLRTYHAGKDFSIYTEADKERQLEDALLLEDPITELAIVMELNYFRLNYAQCFVPLSVKIPGNELVATQRAGLSRAVIDFIGEIRDESGNTVANLRDKVEIELKGEAGGRLASSPVHYDAGFVLAPGNYMLKFLARNAGTGRIGTYQTKFAVPDLSAEKLWLPISSVVLGSQRIPTSSTLFDAGGNKAAIARQVNPLVQEGQMLIPSIIRVFSKGQPLLVYLQAYGRKATDAENLLAYVSFYRKGEKVSETPLYSISDPPQTEMGTVPIRLAVPLDNLPDGEYTCQVTVLSPSLQKAAFWQARVMIVP